MTVDVLSPELLWFQNRGYRPSPLASWIIEAVEHIPFET